MSDNIASPKSTGGGGYTYEDCVGAWWLLHLLSGAAPFDGLGAPSSVRFQARVDGFRLDDHVLECANGRVLASVKSVSQVTANEAPADFVRACWIQVAQTGESRFDPTRDLAVLVQPRLSAAAREVSRDATLLAQGDPLHVHQRVAEPGWTNDAVRVYVRSFEVPDGVRDQIRANAVPGFVLQAVRILEMDFDSPASIEETRALRFAQDLVASGSTDDAKVLWDELRLICREGAPRALRIDVGGLHARLGGRVRLTGHRFHRPVWEWLVRRSEDFRLLAPKGQIGATSISREPEVAALRSAAESGIRRLVLLGESGTGKTSLLGALSAPGVGADDVYRLTVDKLGAFFERVDGVNASVEELLAGHAGARILMAIDGVEWAGPTEMDWIRRLGAALDDERVGGRWTLLLSCQSLAWGEHAAAQLGGDWNAMTLSPLTDVQIRQVRSDNPTVSALLSRPDMRRFASNLRILGWLLNDAQLSLDLATVEKIGEAHLAQALWEHGRRDNVGAWSLVEKLGVEQANRRARAVPIADLLAAAVDEQGLRRLEQRGILAVSDGTDVQFTHDLWGDYARQRRILAQVRAGHMDELLRYEPNPLWHRAIRLAAVHLLDFEGSNDWLGMVTALASNNDGATTLDHLLEAIAFTADPKAALTRGSAQLFANKGRLLRRFLTRFIASCSVPLHAERQSGPLTERLWADTNLRVPVAVLWLPVLEWICARGHDVVAHAPLELAEVAEAWVTPPAWGMSRPLEREIAAFVYDLVDRECDPDGRTYSNREYRERLFTTMLKAARFHPERATALIRLLDGRVERQPANERRRARGTPRRSAPWTGFEREPLPPWPDGPKCRPDSDFERVVVGLLGASFLAQFNPDVAVETFLAVLIDLPRHDDEMSLDRKEYGLNRIVSMEPTFHDFPPALALFRASPDHALDFVRRLTVFVTDRWADQRPLETATARSRPGLARTWQGSR